MRRRPSSRDVASRSGVSQTTVSFVLNGRTDVAIPEETRARVLRAAEEIGYRVNSLARSLVRGETQTIGVVVPYLDDFSDDLIQGVYEVCNGRDRRVILGLSEHDAEVAAKQVNLLLEYRVDGLIFMADEWFNARMAEWLDGVLREGFACILLDDSTACAKADCVVSDDYSGAMLAINHLLELGHRRIGHLSAGSRASTARDRRAGYCAALHAAGLELEEQLIAGDSYVPGGAVTALQALLALPEPPTALFAANDPLAKAALRHLRERGLRVPEDMALVGYGDLEMAECLDLTSVDPDPVQMGRCAAERLFARLADPGLAPQRIVLPTRLVVRRSTAPPGARKGGEAAAK